MAKGKWALVVILFFVLIFAVVPFFRVLALIGPRDEIVFCTRVREGQEFTILFTHSVNKRPVRDFIKIEDDHFLILKSEYDAFGAGMPETSYDGMTVRLSPSGKIEFSNINRRISEIGLFVGTIAEHTLNIGNRDILLTDIVPPGTSIRFTLTKVSFLNLLRSRCLHE